ncbi:uncharacterized protein LOC143038623 [Oratosquilla oratoria]|uniref:uncharacterized protein LOC143038623 n=1 Tax=Oratosquilla oratoria TaxID=337810 RepID=UPI003F764768
MTGTGKAHNIDAKARTDDIKIQEDVDFSQMYLSDHVFQGLQQARYIRPSPIQLRAIPIGRCGLDLLVQAKSGTGKTLVFTILALESVNTSSSACQVLIIAPTREIAVQITQVINEVGLCMAQLRVHTFIGGMPLSLDVAKLQNCHIAVGTPGRVKQLVTLGHLKLDNIRLFVLDEADQLFNGQFLEIMEDFKEALPNSKQVVAASATFTEEVASTIKEIMRSPTEVRLGKDAPSLLGVDQFIRLVPYHHQQHQIQKKKLEVLLKLLSSISFNQCLVFTNSQLRAESISSELEAHGWPVMYLAGSQPQKERLKALNSLCSYKCRILVSTDLSARGIDSEHVNLVINMDVARDAATYLHRVGRAGRFGSHGQAITLAAEGEDWEAMRAIVAFGGVTINIVDGKWKIHSKDDLKKCEKLQPLSNDQLECWLEKQNAYRKSNLETKDKESNNAKQKEGCKNGKKAITGGEKGICSGNEKYDSIKNGEVEAKGEISRNKKKATNKVEGKSLSGVSNTELKQAFSETSTESENKLGKGKQEETKDLQKNVEEEAVKKKRANGKNLAVKNNGDSVKKMPCKENGTNKTDDPVTVNNRCTDIPSVPCKGEQKNKSSSKEIKRVKEINESQMKENIEKKCSGHNTGKLCGNSNHLGNFPVEKPITRSDAYKKLDLDCDTNSDCSKGNISFKALLQTLDDTVEPNSVSFDELKHTVAEKYKLMSSEMEALTEFEIPSLGQNDDSPMHLRALRLLLDDVKSRQSLEETKKNYSPDCDLENKQELSDSEVSSTSEYEESCIEEDSASLFTKTASDCSSLDSSSDELYTEDIRKQSRGKKNKKCKRRSYREENVQSPDVDSDSVLDENVENSTFWHGYFHGYVVGASSGFNVGSLGWMGPQLRVRVYPEGFPVKYQSGYGRGFYDGFHTTHNFASKCHQRKEQCQQYFEVGEYYRKGIRNGYDHSFEAGYYLGVQEVFMYEFGIYQNKLYCQYPEPCLHEERQLPVHLAESYEEGYWIGYIEGLEKGYWHGMMETLHQNGRETNKFTFMSFHPLIGQVCQSTYYSATGASSNSKLCDMDSYVRHMAASSMKAAASVWKTNFQ